METEKIHTPVIIAETRLGLQSLQSCIWDVKYTCMSAHNNKNAQAFLMKGDHSLERDELLIGSDTYDHFHCITEYLFIRKTGHGVDLECHFTFIARLLIGQQLPQKSQCKAFSWNPTGRPMAVIHGPKITPWSVCVSNAACCQFVCPVGPAACLSSGLADLRRKVCPTQDASDGALAEWGSTACVLQKKKSIRCSFKQTISLLAHICCLLLLGNHPRHPLRAAVAYW